MEATSSGISAALDPATPGATGASPVKTKAKYVVWRKFWYQMTFADGYNPPKPSKAEEAYAKVFAEMVKAGEKKFKKEDVPVDLRDRTILKEYMLKKGGANKDVAAIGAHNKNEFTKEPIYKPEPNKHTAQGASDYLRISVRSSNRMMQEILHTPDWASSY